MNFKFLVALCLFLFSLSYSQVTISEQLEHSIKQVDSIDTFDTNDLKKRYSKTLYLQRVPFKGYYLERGDGAQFKISGLILRSGLYDSLVRMSPDALVEYNIYKKKMYTGFFLLLSSIATYSLGIYGIVERNESLFAIGLSSTILLEITGAFKMSSSLNNWYKSVWLYNRDAMLEKE